MEIRPELPNRVVFPGTEIKNGDTWSKKFQKKLNLIPSSIFINGQTDYTYDGSKNISIKAGDFNCAIIYSNTTYTMNSTTMNAGIPEYSNITANLYGINYIDLKSCCTVKLQYNVTKYVFNNFSNLFNGLVSNMYQKDVYESNVTGELINVN